jgi:hypothetical protein
MFARMDIRQQGALTISFDFTEFFASADQDNRRDI